MTDSPSFRKLGKYRTEAKENFQVTTIIITNDLNSSGHVNHVNGAFAALLQTHM